MCRPSIPVRQVEWSAWWGWQIAVCSLVWITDGSSQQGLQRTHVDAAAQQTHTLLVLT